MDTQLPDRFWAKVDRGNPDECWPWTAVQNGVGYGMFWLDGSKRCAHRVAYEALVGPIPDGLDLDHLCRVRHCVNPAHLEPVTRRENARRGLGGARNRAKTHCPQGHPYDAANTLVGVSRVERKCRACQREASRRYRQRQREGASDGRQATDT